MNNQRRKRIDDLRERLEAIHTLLDEIRDEEQEAFDNLPEGLQISGRGESMENGISLMEDCLENLENVATTLEEVTLL